MDVVANVSVTYWIVDLTNENNIKSHKWTKILKKAFLKTNNAVKLSDYVLFVILRLLVIFFNFLIFVLPFLFYMLCKKKM